MKEYIEDCQGILIHHHSKNISKTKAHFYRQRVIIIEDTLNKIILYHIAPTILRLKPANLINFTEFNRLYPSWRNFSRKQIRALFADFSFNEGLEYQEIYHYPGKQALVLFYNEEMLEEVLFNQKNRNFLADCGYKANPNVSECLHQLSQRLLFPKFPHEIGIFLGIPLGDVLGFIANKGKNYIFNHYWKVYQNPLAAKKIFASFDQAKIDLYKKFC